MSFDLHTFEYVQIKRSSSFYNTTGLEALLTSSLALLLLAHPVISRSATVFTVFRSTVFICGLAVIALVSIRQRG